ncbi:site-specific integrase [uncultured Alistipes sp.]|jgi:transposase|uniref:site-specific integrase n=1 Tax=uncultured Alistipes sp. TaxID=538949 RepID=UPI0026000E95|nr:site-specific integrase [uncultured Alistipes sp.]
MQRSVFTILFFIKKSAPKKNGLTTIMVRVTIDGRQTQFSSKLEIDPKFWNQKTNRIRGRNKEGRKMNLMLDAIRMDLHSYYLDLSHSQREVTPAQIKRAFLNNGLEITLKSLFEEHLKFSKRRVGTNLSQESVFRYQVTFDRLLNFLQKEYDIEDISLNRITLRFIELFYLFLRQEHSCTHNTATKYVQRFAAVMRYAERTGQLSNNPFIYYKFSLEPVDPTSLTQEEVKRISQKKFSSKRLEEVRDIFVFSCWTGLSFSDVCSLEKNDIYIAFDEKPWIMVRRNKTNKPSHIPLLAIPLNIIEKYKATSSGERIFSLKSNQKTNEYLREIANLCRIDKHITFRTARHTFATLMLNYGVSLESLSRMLGHTTIKSTQAYARVTDRKIKKEMEKVKDN